MGVEISDLSSGELETLMEQEVAKKNKLASDSLTAEQAKADIRNDIIQLDIKKNELKLKYNNLLKTTKQADTEIKIIEANLKVMDRAAWAKRRAGN